MKAERRHELQTNALATLLTQGIEKSRGYWGTIAWSALAVVAAIVLVSYWSSQRTGSQAEAWQKYYDATNVDPGLLPNRLKHIAESYPNSDVALWARLDLADHLAYDGRQKLDQERDAGVTRLREAQQTYALVLDDPKALPDMIRRAAISEGKCFELMGDREKAIESYRSVAKKLAQSMPAIAKEAERMATQLEKPEAADFYKWFAEYKAPTSPATGADLSFPPTNGSDSSSPTEPAKTPETVQPDSPDDKKANEAVREKSDNPPAKADDPKPGDTSAKGEDAPTPKKDN